MSAHARGDVLMQCPPIFWLSSWLCCKSWRARTATCCSHSGRRMQGSDTFDVCFVLLPCADGNVLRLRRRLKLVVFVLYSFWVPQIAACALHDARQPLMPAYVLGMSASRLALPLYLHGCPHNLLRVPPSRAFCVALVLYVGAQARLLCMMQGVLGFWGSGCLLFQGIPSVARPCAPAACVRPPSASRSSPMSARRRTPRLLCPKALCIC